ncbi:MAG: peptidoglycan glycosyltransferase [Lachnospiraceae bacterium]|nr:peptidoglycan glycosyltransferase [Lachnospiraceae bacterium]
MFKSKTFMKRKLMLVFMVFFLFLVFLIGRLVYLTIIQSDFYQNEALELHQRERSIKAPRGIIYDRNGIVIASNKPVCTISVIYSQMTDKEKVIEVLSKELELDEAEVRKKVEKVSSREKIKSNVDKEVADRIREYELDGVMVDEDYKRYYPYGDLASKVIGFTGADNQGIIGLEVFYDSYLSGTDGNINTLTDAKGIEIKNAEETVDEPVEGLNLTISIDLNIQKYAQQAAQKVYTKKEAKRVSVIAMNPKNGEIYAMVNVPEFDLNEPFTLTEEYDTTGLSSEEINDLRNQMWRNWCINDTYEPGSTFKTVTATAALEEGVVTLEDGFQCPGFRIVEDRKIKCHKVVGHGSESFKQAFMNSCNPVFMDVGARVGVENMYKNYEKLGLFRKTGVDLPGEANSIMHNKENVGPVELATMSFGQSIQITPLQLIVAVSAMVNGGNIVTPHFGMYITNSENEIVETLEYPIETGVIRKETSDTMKILLESVVEEGGGSKAIVEGYRIGGKTATSEKLPRSSNKYIASFIGVAPADDPVIAVLVLIDEPTGVYYGGTIAAPVAQEIFENILPYLGIPMEYEEKVD